MAATFRFDLHYGSTPTLATDVQEVNWKSADDVATAYTAAPMVVGTHSYPKWLYGRFGGTYTQILNGRFAHTAGALPTGVSLFGQPTMTQNADKLTYPSPSRSSNASLTTDMSSAVDVAAGSTVWFGLGGPADTKTATFSPSGDVTACTNYLVTQLRTASNASAGDYGPVTLTVRFDEV